MTSTTPPPLSSARAARPRRRRAIRFAVGVGLVGVVASVAGYAWLRATATVRDQGEDCSAVRLEVADGVSAAEPELRAGICETLAGLVTAWDEADASAYGAHFTEDATYVAFTGTVYRGRADIVAGHAALFDGLLAGSRLTSRYLDVRVTGDSTAVVTARGDTYEDDPPSAPGKVQTLVLLRGGDGRWLVTAFHNTQRQPAMERFQFLLNPGSVPARERAGADR